MTHMIAMAMFALALSASPGPVNILALSSGYNRGLMQSLPFVLGATLGFCALLYMIGKIGINLLADYPMVVLIFNLLGTGYIVYMGWGLIRAAGVMEDQGSRHPHFKEGVVLQWINPKAWIACLSGIAAFVSNQAGDALIIFCLIYLGMCFIGVGTWAALGALGKNFLHHPKVVARINKLLGATLWGLAAYLIYSLL